MDTDLKREEGSNSRLNVKLNNKSLMERNQYEVASRRTGLLYQLDAC